MLLNGIGSQTGGVYQTTTNNGSTPVKNEGTGSVSSGTQIEDELQEIQLDETEDVEKTEEEQALDNVNNQLELSEKQYGDKIQNYYKQIEQLNKQLETIDKQRQTMIKQLAAGGETSNIASGLKQLNSQKQSVIDNIMSILLSIEDLETALEEGRIKAQESIDKINEIINQKQSVQNIQTALENTSNAITPDMGMGDVIATLGNSFVGIINDDAAGNAAFSDGVSQHWCADFVTSVVEMACQATGKTVPSGFGSSSVTGLMEWGKSNGTFLQTAGAANKAELIAKNIKAGDVLIQKENGASHTGIVTKVYPDGSFDTVEGNSSDAVKNRHYSANSDILTGFIQLNI